MRWLLCAFPLLSLPVAFAQQYPGLGRVEIAVNAIRDSASHYFYYSYTLSNDFRNTGSIAEFEVDVTRSANTVLLDTVGLQFGGDEFQELSFRERWPFLAPYTVPVGFLSSPEHWDMSWGNYSLAHMRMDTLFIAPGKNVSGLVLMSRGIPGIRKCTVTPDFNDDLYFPSLDDTTREMTTDQMDSIRAAGVFHGLTVGPVAPPLRIEPVAFLDETVSTIRQSYSQNWLKSRSAMGKYSQKFAGARSLLQLGDIEGAMLSLRKILTAASTDNSSDLSPEGFALIYYNTEYLLEHLSISSPTNR